MPLGRLAVVQQNIGMAGHLSSPGKRLYDYEDSYVTMSPMTRDLDARELLTREYKREYLLSTLAIKTKWLCSESSERLPQNSDGQLGPGVPDGRCLIN